MIERRFIGWRSEPIIVEVERGHLRLFAKGTGETDPIYFDEEAARAAGHPALPAPPTFAFCLANLAGQPYSYLRLMDVDIARLLHGEQAFEYFSPYHAGDVLTLTTEIADITAKKGGALELIEAHTDAVNQRGQCCVKQRTVLIVRNEGARDE
ncbi:MAG: MaoC family dehydratase N-terminal domain-containing protein [Hyphomonadaceae bacterium]